MEKRGKRGLYKFTTGICRATGKPKEKEIGKCRLPEWCYNVVGCVCPALEKIFQFQRKKGQLRNYRKSRNCRQKEKIVKSLIFVVENNFQFGNGKHHAKQGLRIKIFFVPKGVRGYGGLLIRSVGQNRLIYQT